MQRREFISGGIGLFAIAAAGRAFGANAASNRVRLKSATDVSKGLGAGMTTVHAIIR